MQLRVIFDTNIYGNIVLEKNVQEFLEKIKTDKDFVVYGFGLIRKELRDTPKKERIGLVGTRNYLLQVYDAVIGAHYLENSAKIDYLAKKFYGQYRTVGGIHPWEKVKIDMTIVACACMNSLDVVYSDDESTLASKSAQKAYKHITLKENLRVPTFYKYKDLKEKYNIK